MKEVKDEAGLALVVEAAMERHGVFGSAAAKKAIVDEILTYFGQIVEDSGL